MTRLDLPGRSLYLWIEFLLLYLAVPLAAWLFLIRAPERHGMLYILLLGAFVIGILLLSREEKFRFRELWDVSGLSRQILSIVLFSLGAGLLLTAVVWLHDPERLFVLAREEPRLLAMIWCLYPFFSVLGQELLYRPLFFRRYGRLFPHDHAALFANAVLFSLAHLMFEHVLVLAITFAGGWIFGRTYQKTGSFPLVFILHWIGGGLVFTVGLGWLFYLGGYRMSGGG